MFNSDLKGSDILLTGVVAGFRLLQYVRARRGPVSAKKKRKKRREEEREGKRGKKKKTSLIPGVHFLRPVLHDLIRYESVTIQSRSWNKSSQT